MQTGAVTLKQIGRIAKAKPQWWEKEEFFESPEKDQSSVDYSTSQGDASPGVASSASTTTGSYVAGSPQVKYDVSGNKLPEAKLYDAMKKAKNGDQRALFDTLMADRDHLVMPVQDMDSQYGSTGSHFATNMQSDVTMTVAADANGEADAVPSQLAVESEPEGP